MKVNAIEPYYCLYYLIRQRLELYLGYFKSLSVSINANALSLQITVGWAQVCQVVLDVAYLSGASAFVDKLSAKIEAAVSGSGCIVG